MSTPDDTYFIVLCSDPVQGQYTRFRVWTGKAWSIDPGEAMLYPTYSKAAAGMYVDIPEEKVLGKIIPVPRTAWASLAEVRLSDD